NQQMLLGALAQPDCQNTVPCDFRVGETNRAASFDIELAAPNRIEGKSVEQPISRFHQPELLPWTYRKRGYLGFLRNIQCMIQLFCVLGLIEPIHGAIAMQTRPYSL